ncbi:MAG TPA: LTA synthase family protein, partial [Methylotenera sp.]|nr:LTA synthase family protein [Methylotenera sp.]
MTQLLKAKPRRTIPFVGFIAILTLTLWLVLRLVLWFSVGVQQLNPFQVLQVFAVGTWFDLHTLGFLLVPWLILSVLLPNYLRNKAWLPTLRWVLVWMIAFSLIFGAASEFIFWQEFTTRFNFIAVDYLIYTHEVIGNILESYPVPLIVTTIALAALALVLLAKRYITFEHQPYSSKRKIVLLALAVVVPALSFQVANVDQMQVSRNAYANELAGNGLFSFAAAMYRNELDYDKFYQTIPQSVAIKTLASIGVDRKPTNVILVSEHDDALHLKAESGPFIRRPKN